MKIFLDKNAKNFADKKNIKELFIHPDLTSKETCCTIGTVDFDVSTKLVGNKENYKKYKDQFVDIYVNPNIFSFIDDDYVLDIGVFGLGSFKKFYIKNEINTIER